MSYFKLLVQAPVQQAVAPSYRCTEFLTRSAFLTRPNPTSTDRPDPGLVGRDKIKPMQTKGWSVYIN